MTWLRTRFLPLAIVAALACRPGGSTGDAAGGDTQDAGRSGRAATLSGDEARDRALLERLEREARALATTSGCESATSCKAAPVGAKACGGPRGYLVYCVRSTDEPALLAKLDTLQRLEREFNTRHNIISTCEFISPPEVEVAGGVCRAR